jgi:AcrR family transcriptional regulator
MPLPRFGGLDAEKRRHLMDVAVERFAEKGYEGASLNEILATAGFGKSSYYYYFADKEDLFATVIEDFWSRIEAEGPPLSFDGLDAATFWPTLDILFARLVAVTARYPNLVALARDVRAMWRNPSPRIRPLVEKAAATQRRMLELGRELGCVRTDIDVDWLLSITEAADQAVDERFFGHGEPTPETLREHGRVALDVFRRLVERV